MNNHGTSLQETHNFKQNMWDDDSGDENMCSSDKEGKRESCPCA
jgi:hypothetical protein